MSTVASVRVGVYVTHTYRSDLTIDLIGPDGTTTVTVANYAGGSGHDFGSSAADAGLCILDDAASTTIDDLGDSDPSTGSFKPSFPLSAFVGLTWSETWTLRLQDHYSADSGTLRAAVLWVTTDDAVVHRLVGTGLSLDIPDHGAPVASSFAAPPPPNPVNLAPSFAADLDVHAELRTVRPALADQPDTITEAFVEAWQGAPFTSGDVPGDAITAPPQHIGDKRPRMKVMVRNGEIRRDRRYWNSLGYPVGASVASSSNVHPWQATWHPHTPWRAVEGVLEVGLDKSFDQNGVGTASIQIANIAYPENEGGGHDVRRGFMAPLRGYSPPSLPLKHPPADLDGVAVDANEWGDTWKAKVQVEVFQTYGDAPWVKTFTGLVDDIDDTSRPDVLTLTCRDFGEILVDSHIFGWNKDPHIRGPVIFVGHDEAYSLSHSAYNPNASSRIASHHSDLALDDDRRTYWRSGVDAADATEWIEFDVAEGFYEDIYIDGRFLDSSGDWDKHYDDVYVSIRPTSMSGGGNPTREGVDLTPGSFADIGAGSTPRGTPYVAHYSSVGAAAKRALGGRFKLGKDSTIRITFAGLPSLPSGGYAAGARNLYAIKEKLVADAIRQHWVVVEDISDVVKVILRWAGFKEWEVESTGADLPRRLVFQPGDTYMDAINKVADAIGYTFFMKDPSASSGSLGVPVFRKSWALVNDGAGRNRRLTITDRVLLTGVNLKDSEEELRTTIRTLGRESDKGTNFGFGGTKRIMFFYRPPWALRNFTDDRVGGILKHAVYKNPLWKTIDLCRFAAYDIALREAMAQIVASVEFPGTGSVDLDEHVLISDLGTGVISRLCVSNRTSTFVTGEKAKWTMTTAGGLIDVPNVQAMVEIINDAVDRD